MKKFLIYVIILCVFSFVFLSCKENGEITVSRLIKLGEYKGYTYTKISDEVTDELVLQTMENSRNMDAERYDITDRTDVRVGDMVNLSYNSYIDGEEHGNMYKIPVKVGANHYNEEFEADMIGKTVGEDYILILQIPENHEDSSIAGKTIEYHYRMDDLYSYNFLDMESYARSLGFESEQAYFEDTKRMQKYNLEYVSRMNETTEIIAKVIEVSEFEIAFSDIERNYNNNIDSESKLAETYGMTLEEYAKKIKGMTLEQLEDDCKERASEYIKRELILKELINIAGLTFNIENDEELEAACEKYGGDPLTWKTEPQGATEAILTNMAMDYLIDCSIPLEE